MKADKFFYILLLAFFAFNSCKQENVDANPQPNPNPPITNPVTIDETGLVVFSPSLPAADDNITITFDASKGNAGLLGATEVYIYTGVITDKSTSPADWKFVKSPSFSVADPAAKMTSLGSNKFQFKLTPSSFYNVPATDKILKLVMVFRTADGSRAGRNTDNSDIYIPIYEKGKLEVRFTSPEFQPLYTPVPLVNIQNIGQELTVGATSSKSASLTLSLNGENFATATNKNAIAGIAKIKATGQQTVKVTATDGGTTTEASFKFTINGEVQTATLPANAKDGVTFINNGTSVIFNLYAPAKDFAYVIGDFNDWETTTTAFMKRTPDGNNWWVQIDNIDPNKEYAYQYFVNGTLRIADPYAEKLLDPNNDNFISGVTYPNLKAYPSGKTSGIVSTFQSGAPAYNWQMASFTRPEKKDLIIYELHLRDFLTAHDYKTLRDTLNYLSNLGINAIELMPVTEFEGNSSWGYNVSFYFAPDKYYGSKNLLKAVIDESHKRGIAIILDMVLNHSFGQSPMVQLYFDQASGKPAANNPWFNVDAKHPYNVGYDFNHESAATKYFSKKVMEYWMKEYKVDGFRFDLSKGFTQNNTGTSDAGVAAWGAYDAGRIAIWKQYNDFIKSIDNNFYVILEHFAEDREEKELAAEGMMLWNNMNYNFNEATMGYVSNSNLSRAFYDSHGFTEPNLVTYMESHDEERLMFKNLQYGNSNGGYSVKNMATALKRQEMAAAFLMFVPGPKMIWQFGELGYDVSIDENGRTGEKPIRWQYNTDVQRKTLYNTYAGFISMRKNNDVFSSTNYQYNVSGAVKFIKYSSAAQNVVVIGNFDVVSQTANVSFPQNGTWYDKATGQTINVSGNYNAVLAPGEYHIFSTSPLL
jgi:1,4-alpha-glucan branching enzyme